MFEFISPECFEHFIKCSGFRFSGHDYPGIPKIPDMSLNIIIKIFDRSHLNRSVIKKCIYFLTRSYDKIDVRQICLFCGIGSLSMRVTNNSESQQNENCYVN